MPNDVVMHAWIQQPVVNQHPRMTTSLLPGPGSSETVQGDGVELSGPEEPGGIPPHPTERADHNHHDQEETLQEEPQTESSLEVYAGDVGEEESHDVREDGMMEQDGEAMMESESNYEEETNAEERRDATDSNPNENHEVLEADYVDLLNGDPENYTTEAEGQTLLDEYEDEDRLDEDQVEKEHAQMEKDLLDQEQAEEQAALEEEQDYENQDSNSDSNSNSNSDSDESGDQTNLDYDATFEEAVEDLYRDGESMVDSQGNPQLTEEGNATENPPQNSDQNRPSAPHQNLNNPKLIFNQANGVVPNHIPANVQKPKVVKPPLANHYRNNSNQNDKADSDDDDDDKGQAPVVIPLANPHLPVQVEPSNASNGVTNPQSHAGRANPNNQANYRPDHQPNQARSHLVHPNRQTLHRTNHRRVQGARNLNLQQRRVPNNPNLQNHRIHNASNSNLRNPPARNLANPNTHRPQSQAVHQEGTSLEHPTVMMSLLSGSYLKCPVCSRQDPRGRCRPVFWCGVWSAVAVNTSAV